MKVKKVLRYYSDCGRGFWKKQQAITHDENCKCWKNPKFKCCLSCRFKNIIKDSNGMEHEPQFLQTWDMNYCNHSESGIAAHQNFEHIRKYCQFYESAEPKS
jgi:hypothetical protein